MKADLTVRSYCGVLATGLVFGIGVPDGLAQVAPAAAEVAAYTGLHRAAAEGHAAEAARLVGAGSNVNGRDGYGRTPLHVAAFFSRRDAYREMMQILERAGAR